MTDIKINQTKEFFENNIKKIKNEMITLKADNRNDEAVFKRIEMNVYDIFFTVFNTALKISENDETKLKTFFLKKAEEIPSNWEASLKKAIEHNEADKAAIENIKLDAIKQIKENFNEIW